MIKLGVFFPMTCIGFVHAIVPALMFSGGIAGAAACNEAVEIDFAQEAEKKKATGPQVKEESRDLPIPPGPMLDEKS